jgi:hypothetical protein
LYAVRFTARVARKKLNDEHGGEQQPMTRAIFFPAAGKKISLAWVLLVTTRRPAKRF